MNRIKTLVFLSVLSGFCIGVGALLGGLHGAVLGFGLACILSFFSYWFADRIALLLHRAEEVRPIDSLGLYEILERLAERARLPTPRICIVPDSSPNAFAVGRSPYHATVVVTQGLLGLLSYDELEGVLAHEIAHIKSRDTLIGGIVTLLASGILFFAHMSYWNALLGMSSFREPKRVRQSAWNLVLLSIFSPPAALVVRLTLSRAREFNTDQMGAELCGQPEWLASALRKIYNMGKGAPIAQGNPLTLAAAHLYIVSPFSAAILPMFNTHPPVEERVQRLLQLKYGRYRSAQSGVLKYVRPENP